MIPYASMPIPDHRIDDFIARWKRAFGEELTRDAARIEAERVLHLYRRMLEHRRADVRDVGDVAEKPMQRAEAQAADAPPAPASEFEAV
jgi:hypothetical protein